MLGVHGRGGGAKSRGQSVPAYELPDVPNEWQVLRGLSSHKAWEIAGHEDQNVAPTAVVGHKRGRETC